MFKHHPGDKTQDRTHPYTHSQRLIYTSVNADKQHLNTTRLTSPQHKHNRERSSQGTSSGATVKYEEENPGFWSSCGRSSPNTKHAEALGDALQAGPEQSRVSRRVHTGLMLHVILNETVCHVWLTV